MPTKIKYIETLIWLTVIAGIFSIGFLACYAAYAGQAIQEETIQLDKQFSDERGSGNPDDVFISLEGIL